MSKLTKNLKSKVIDFNRIAINTLLVQFLETNTKSRKYEGFYNPQWCPNAWYDDDDYFEFQDNDLTPQQKVILDGLASVCVSKYLIDKEDINVRVKVKEKENGKKQICILEGGKCGGHCNNFHLSIDIQDEEEELPQQAPPQEKQTDASENPV